MKLSFSLADDLAGALSACAGGFAGGNASFIAEVALKRFLQLPPHEIGQLVARHRIDRKAATRSGWAEAFWNVLGELMGQPDQNVFNSPYAPRRFGDFYVVLLMRHMNRPDDESDPFSPYVGPMPVTPDSPAPFQWDFDRSTSPVVAAEAVAAKLHEYGVKGCGLSPRR